MADSPLAHALRELDEAVRRISRARAAVCAARAANRAADRAAIRASRPARASGEVARLREHAAEGRGVFSPPLHAVRTGRRATPHAPQKRARSPAHARIGTRYQATLPPFGASSPRGDTLLSDADVVLGA